LSDLYLVKVDGEGDIIWSRTFGGRGMDLGFMVRQTPDGGYILIGDRGDATPTGNLYQSELYLIKTDPEGDLVWSQTYARPGHVIHIGYGVAVMPDGGYVITGMETTHHDRKPRNVVAKKVSETGEEEWHHDWDLGDWDEGTDIILTSDNHIVMACIQSMGSGAPSAVLIKLDLEGNEIWTKIVGTQYAGNTFWHIMEDVDGGYIMAGDTHLGEAQQAVSYSNIIHGGWIAKTDRDGELIWQHTFGGEDYNFVSFNSAALLPGGGHLFVGQAARSGERYTDMIWLKTDTEGNLID
jgi:hypothetical protein